MPASELSYGRAERNSTRRLLLWLAAGAAVSCVLYVTYSPVASWLRHQRDQAEQRSINLPPFVITDWQKIRYPDAVHFVLPNGERYRLFATNLGSGEFFKTPIRTPAEDVMTVGVSSVGIRQRGKNKAGEALAELWIFQKRHTTRAWECRPTTDELYWGETLVWKNVGTLGREARYFFEDSSEAAVPYDPPRK